MHIIQIKNMTKAYEGVHALANLSLVIEKNKVTGIIGPNGSGKSTLMHALTGMTTFDSGVIIVNQSSKLEVIKPYDVPLYGITRTFQEVKLFNQMTVLDNILVILTERGVWASLLEKHSDFHLNKARQLLQQVNLLHKQYELAGNLSYGQRKLLEIARTLAMNAEVYLLDEPFAGLFPEIIKTIVGIIKELRTNGKTVVLIEHNMALIQELCDMVIVLDSGSVLFSGKPAEVLQSKKVVEAYLGE